MIVLGIDPGFEQSALVVLDGALVLAHEIINNDVVLTRLERPVSSFSPFGIDVLVIEQIAMGGMIAGAEVFETCYWTGRFVERWAGKWARLKRKDVKMHLCGQVNAKDANIRQALIDRFGPSKQKAIGTAKTPGPLHGIASHEWAALAVAVTYHDQHKGEL